MRTYLVAGNWKMNGRSASNNALMAGLTKTGMDGVEILVCPPFPYLVDVAGAIGSASIELGAQDCSAHSAGAFTGEVEAGMLRDLGVSYVIVGHSERRAMHAESDEIVAAKFMAAVESGLKPILCLGETLAERESGQTGEVVARQLETVIQQAGIERFSNAVVAYEPVWAIGTGKTATPEMAEEVHAEIRQLLHRHDRGIADATRILYGGSMKGSNADGLLAMENIDGGLIGGASLKADDFMAIAAAAKNLSNH